jgi:hypothetical protein
LGLFCGTSPASCFNLLILFCLCFLGNLHTVKNGGDCFNTHVGGSISDESDSVFTSPLSNKINLRLGGMIMPQRLAIPNAESNLTLLMGGGALASCECPAFAQQPKPPHHSRHSRHLHHLPPPTSHLPPPGQGERKGRGGKEGGV